MCPALSEKLEELLNSNGLKVFLRDASYILLDPSRDCFLVVMYNSPRSNLIARFLSDQLVNLSGSDKELSTPLFSKTIKPKKIIPYVYNMDDGDNYSSLVSHYGILREKIENSILIASTSGVLPTDCEGKVGVYTCDINFILNQK